MLGGLAAWGGWQVASGAWTSGALAGLLTLLGLVLSPLRDFAIGLGGWRNWRVSCEKLASFLHNAPLPVGAWLTGSPLPVGCFVRLESLIVAAGTSPVSAERRQRDTLAVQGPSGSGKSALLEVVAGLLVPLAGRVVLDGQDSAGADPVSRKPGVALVAADLPLLRGSVAGNLRYRRKAIAHEAMQRALAAAGVRALACGAALDLRDTVAEGGRNLPRVLRARLALARALVDTPALLLIDDFDALLEGETAVDAPLAALILEPPCSIVIATRSADWAARCSQRVLLEPAAAAAGPNKLELVRAA
jgi:ABC-type multidrug transport system fused ATPase/permease subunit